MQTTRARIIDLLRGGHTVTIDDITRELSLAPATVRRHLDVLQRDGLVETSAARQALGRPYFVFRLTLDGRDSLPEHQIRLTKHVLELVLSLQPSETAGRSGADLAEMIFERLAECLVRDCRQRITASSLDARLAQTVEALAEAGFEFGLERAEGGFMLRGAGCPCRRLLAGAEGRCDHDERIIGALLGTPVERLDSDDGAAAYRVPQISAG